MKIFFETKDNNRQDNTSYLSGRKNIEDWLESLPRTDDLVFAKNLLEYVKLKNSESITVKERMLITDTLEKPIKQLSTSSKRHQIGLTLPLPEHGIQLLSLITELNIEQARSYRSVVEYCVNQQVKSLPIKEREILDYINRGLGNLLQALRLSYGYYRKIPRGLWRNVHDFFRMAVYFKSFDETDVRYPIVGSYVQALLLGLSDPYHLPFNTVDRIVQHLPSWIPYTRLNHEKAEKSGCQFAISPSTDYPALPVLPHSHADRLNGTYYLHTNLLVARLKSQLEEIARETIGGDKTQALEMRLETIEMLKSLIIYWGKHPIRSSHRTQIEENCELLCGIRSINFVLNGNKPFVEQETFMDLDTTQNMLLGTFGYQLEKAEHPDALPSFWETVDESKHGLHLVLTTPNDLQISVGDMVAFRMPLHDEDWRVGVVRWAKSSHSEDRLELGIFKLGEGAFPAGIRIIHTDADQADPPLKPAVGFPSQSDLGRQQSVIAHTGIYGPDRQLWIRFDRENHIIRATNLIMSTRSVDWFEFRLEKL